MSSRQEFVQLTPEFWITQSRWLNYNSGIFIDQGRACLIDPGMDPQELEGLRRFLAAQGAAPEVILLTHWHWDHVLGPERFPGVRVAAHSAYAEEARCNEAGILAEIARWEAEAGLGRERAFALPMPDEALEDGALLRVGGLTLRLVHVPGHARDQMAVYHPARGALWAADTLSDLEIPFVSDCLEDYEAALDRLASLDLRVLAPGHGSATTDASEIRSRLEHDQAYLRALREGVARALDAGLSLEEAVQALGGQDYRCRAENEPYHRLNVESAYLELGGEGDAQQVGWGRE